MDSYKTLLRQHLTNHQYVVNYARSYMYKSNANQYFVSKYDLFMHISIILALPLFHSLSIEHMLWINHSNGLHFECNYNTYVNVSTSANQ